RQVEPRVLSRGRLLVVAGQESLLIYVVHLPILFGSAWNPDTGLVKLLGTALPVAEAVLVWVLLTAVLVLLACWWSWWKQSSGWRAAAAKWWLAGYFTYAFLTA
ncbi:MAG TPA: hypothetical protein VJ417_11215, partial [Candidatus Glassbacteria bacterium]|nr:hypothetical protein [Candidatus Glassbacteria bacterium]